MKHHLTHHEEMEGGKHSHKHKSKKHHNVAHPPKIATRGGAKHHSKPAKKHHEK